MSKSSSVSTVSTFIVCVSALICLYGLYFVGSTAILVAHSEKAQGIVTGLHPVRRLRINATEQNRISYFPIVAFQTQEGKPIHFESNVGAGGYGPYEVGDEVEVLYDPKNPTDARINSFIQLWLIGIFPLVLGGFFLVGSSKVFRKRNLYP